MKKYLLLILLLLMPTGAWAAPAAHYVTPAGAGAKDGAAWASAFGETEFEADLEANAEAGDIYYVLAGTYTLNSSYDASGRDATAVAPISIIGVKAATSAEPPVLADWGSSTDRPTFAGGADYTFVFGDYYKIYNIIFTGSNGNHLVTSGTYAKVYNCKVTNTTATANKVALQAGTGSHFISSEAQSTNGYGVALSANSFIAYSYLHDSTNCLSNNAGGVSIFNVFDTCTTGIYQGGIDIGFIFGNTFYNSTTAVSATDAFGIAVINNIIDTTTDGFLWTTQTDSNFFAFNHVGSSVTDMWDLVNETVAAHKDNWVTGGAGTSCSFTNAANGDFSFAKTGSCVDSGMGLTFGTSTVGKANQGAYSMTQNPASSSGGASAW